MTKSVLIVAPFLLALPAGAPAQQHDHDHDRQDDDLGQVEFQVSCQPAVQAEFDRAVALLHHMMYVESRAAFQQISERSPECAMAPWGVAMTLFQPLWPSRPSADDLVRGRDLVQRAMELGPSTERERHLVAAAAAFYQDPDADWWSRIRSWAAAMETAYDAHSDDIETSALYALSQLAVGAVSDDRMAHQARAAEVLLGIHNQVPTHPGAIHYTIHANDVQGRANESLQIVRSYDDIAPSVPHALHMPTHIYVRLGEWPGVIEWNRKSADAALEFPAGDAVSHHYVHAMDYLVYAHLQQGADDAAASVIAEASAKSPHQPTFVSAFHLSAMPARFAVERRAWAEAAALPARAQDYIAWDRFWWPEAMTWFAKGLGAVHTGDLEGARAAHARMAELSQQAAEAGEDAFRRYIETDRLVLAGFLAHAEGNVDAALMRLREAVDMEASVQKHPVTPGTLLPPYEALGELLLELGRPAEALAAYQSSLGIWPNRYHSLLGAARAANQADNHDEARAMYRTLLDVVGDAETGRPGVDEARAALESD